MLGHNHFCRVSNARVYPADASNIFEYRVSVVNEVPEIYGRITW
ncbi:hypothetical protein K227x_59020 [Rubripirellula lacrimiformis]|uniref:Uncharacterized protein n=1 Tax=Rubripirellula lacrimiformis TaxID=1930273 RepID=A0A517NK15_9BACT|nr:hypothetical protein K227x_59020 [Rubripirellula lacrimiformis]